MGMYSAEVGNAAGFAAGIIIAVFVAYLVAIALGITMYILQALGLYTIAQRRGIKHPWMAWLPVTDMWILGSIADQYRYVACGQIRNRRKVLLGLMIGYVAVWIAYLCFYIGFVIDMAMQAPAMSYMGETEVMTYMGGFFLRILIIGLAALAVAVTSAVFRYICLYDLYASCSPKNKVVFLVLSILVNVTMPFFVFACRKQDEGMPPRKDEPVAPELIAAPEEL